MIEHLYPRELLVEDLLKGENMDPSAAVELLARRVMAAVLTRDEDRLLPGRGERGDTWGRYDADPWLRYRSAATELSAFSPVGPSGA